MPARLKAKRAKRKETAMFEDSMTDKNRRRFLTVSAIGLVVAPMGSFLLSRNAEARGSSAVIRASAEIPKLPENDKQAIALGYREDANLVDTANSNRGKDQTCQNCQLYSGSPSDEWGPCAVFSYRIDPKLNKNYVVSGKGWCKSWGPRASG
jgi:hypothetical protein